MELLRKERRKKIPDKDDLGHINYPFRLVT